MATLPTPEESARAILAIFKSLNVHPGHILMAGQVDMAFLKTGRAAAEYAAGLKFADEKGWLEAGGKSSLKLTDAGFAEM